MPLFDLAPKDSSRSLFGRDREVSALVRLVREGRWAVILGPRMVGKTSLAKVAARRSRRPFLYVNLWGARGTEGLLRGVQVALNGSRPLLSRLGEHLRRIEGITLGPAGVQLTPHPRPLRTVWDLLSLVGSELGDSVVVLDEAQELAAISGPLLRALANVFNSYPGVVFVFTGSRFGLLRMLLEPPADSPMFGRPPAEVRLEPFDRGTSISFLERGLREYRRELPEPTLASIVDRSLDGLPGWLALFGNNLTVQDLPPTDAERATLREGRRVAASELGHFLEGRTVDLYWTALRTLATGAAWSEVRSSLSLRRGSPVNDNTVALVLRSLQDASLVEESEGRYRIRDPMIRSYVLRSPRPPQPRRLRG